MAAYDYKRGNLMVDTKILTISKNERYILSAGAYEIKNTIGAMAGSNAVVTHNNHDLYEHASIKMCQEFLVRLTNWLLQKGNAEITVDTLMAGAKEEETDE